MGGPSPLQLRFKSSSSCWLEQCSAPSSHGRSQASLFCKAGVIVLALPACLVLVLCSTVPRCLPLLLLPVFFPSTPVGCRISCRSVRP